MFNVTYPIIFVSFLISFFSALILTPFWIKCAKRAGLMGKDMHKINQPKIAEIGGVIVIISFIFGILFYLALDTFHLEFLDFLSKIFRDLELMAAILTITLVTIIGLLDDILGWKIGLKQWQKPFLVIIAALPMAVVGLGHSAINIPFIGNINLGIFYSFFIVPIAISGAANGFNMLAGYNGLEAGMGIMVFILSFKIFLK